MKSSCIFSTAHNKCHIHIQIGQSSKYVKGKQPSCEADFLLSVEENKAELLQRKSKSDLQQLRGLVILQTSTELLEAEMSWTGKCSSSDACYIYSFLFYTQL